MKRSPMENILESQERVLRILAEHMDGFYFVGGTALAREYLHHRESYDLDFFTKVYSARKIEAVARLLEKTLKTKGRITIDSSGSGGFVRMRRYEFPISKPEPLKIDFVKDPAPLLRPFHRVRGIDYASLDDIYLRKVYAVTGVIIGTDKLGKIRTRGKRQEARDLFDLYHLSTRHEKLSVFADKYYEHLEIPALVQWYYSLNKPEMSIGLKEDIITAQPIEFVDAARHFRVEIEALMKEVTG